MQIKEMILQPVVDKLDELTAEIVSQEAENYANAVRFDQYDYSQEEM